MVGSPKHEIFANFLNHWWQTSSSLNYEFNQKTSVLKMQVCERCANEHTALKWVKGEICGILADTIMWLVLKVKQSSQQNLFVWHRDAVKLKHQPYHTPIIAYPRPSLPPSYPPRGHLGQMMCISVIYRYLEIFRLGVCYRWIMCEKCGKF